MNNNDIVPGFDDQKDDSLNIRLQKIDGIPGCLVLYLTGYIDTYNSNYFQKRVAKAIEAGFTKLIFHRGGLNLVSDTDIGSFTAFLKAVKPLGGDLVMVEMPPKVYEVYQLLGFSHFFNYRKNVEQGVAFFKQASPFPKIFRCTYCSEFLEAKRLGVVRCAHCGSSFSINATGEVSQKSEIEVNHAQGKETDGETTTREITVMLINIIDYASLCERMPLDVPRLLNQQYFKPVHESIEEFAGNIGEMIGDRQSAYWSGKNNEENAILACRAAITMINRIIKDSLNRPLEQQFKVNIGISTGKTVFMMYDPSLIAGGPLINQASILVEIGKSLSKRILIDHETFCQLPNRLKTQLVEAKTINDLPVYALLGVYK